MLGLPIIGTLGIILAAKRQGLLTVIRPHLDTLIGYGFHLAPTIYEQALKEAGE
ncbi:MAG: DUF3368 domain-containing protein [Chloroflexota bacterium]